MEKTLEEKIEYVLYTFKFDLMRNLEITSELPNDAEFKMHFQYLLLFLEMHPGENYEKNEVLHQYLDKCAYSKEDIQDMLKKASSKDKLLEILDYLEWHHVKEIEKDMYGHGNKCYTALRDDLQVVIDVKKKKYGMKYKNMRDLLIRGYYFKEEVADRFLALAENHISEECPGY